MIVTFNIIGYITDIRPPDQFSQKFTISTAENPTGEKYPQYIEFVVNSKKTDVIATLAGASKGDKVSIEFAPWNKSGISNKTQRPYSINELSVKTLTVIQKGAVINVPTQGEEMPF